MKCSDHAESRDVPGGVPHGASHGAGAEIETERCAGIASGSLSSMLLGVFMVSGARVAGEARWAAALRRFATPALREHAGVVRAGLGVLILLLVIWGPVPWTTKVIPILAFAGGAFLWLEWIRARTLDEGTADTPPSLAVPIPER